MNKWKWVCVGLLGLGSVFAAKAETGAGACTSDTSVVSSLHGFEGGARLSVVSRVESRGGVYRVGVSPECANNFRRQGVRDVAESRAADIEVKKGASGIRVGNGVLIIPKGELSLRVRRQLDAYAENRFSCGAAGGRASLAVSWHTEHAEAVTVTELRCS